mmetsp:Transcript_14853/g.37574  ORF Transcript_14853/g.37574 Transcript_14853/m.37574 type:complete len:236 (+) Transcript_14853:437-1144(+)
MRRLARRSLRAGLRSRLASRLPFCTFTALRSSALASRAATADRLAARDDALSAFAASSSCKRSGWRSARSPLALATAEAYKLSVRRAPSVAASALSTAAKAWTCAPSSEATERWKSAKRSRNESSNSAAFLKEAVCSSASAYTFADSLAVGNASAISYVWSTCTLSATFSALRRRVAALQEASSVCAARRPSATAPFPSASVRWPTSSARTSTSPSAMPRAAALFAARSVLLADL